MAELVSELRSSDGSHVDVMQYPAGLHLEPHEHGSTAISMVLTGRLREDSGAHRALAGALDLVVKPRGTRHENLFLDAGTTLVQVVPSSEALRRAADAGCPVDRWQWIDGAPAARALVRLAAAVIGRAAEIRLDDAVEDALAALDGADRRRPAGRPPAWLQRVREALDEAIGQGREVPPISDLATGEGVHRVHLSREFRRWYGVPPTEYRVRERLRRAANRIGAGEEPLAATAYATGYADQAHMTREFSSRLGLTPLAYRRLLPGAASA
ncbi:MAG: AraC family transcriptional regulator [Gemmatimonadales bacterium]|jgi:AraC family transcriptional regulator